MTEKFLKGKFKEYNTLYFNGSLKQVVIKTFKGRSVAGRFVCTEDKKTGRLKSKTIYIASNVEWDEHTLRRVLVHEMIHYYIARNQTLFWKKDWFSHGKNFKTVMKDINSKYGLDIKIRDTDIQFTDKKEPPKSFFKKLWWYFKNRIL